MIHLAQTASAAPVETIPAAVAALLAEAADLHERCNREPAVGLATVEQRLGALDEREIDSTWLPLVTATLENGATAAEYRLGRLREALERAERVSDALRKSTLLHASATWIERHDRALAASVRIAAVILDAQGDHASALRRHREVIALFESLGDRLNLAKSWHNLSILYARTMLFTEAVEAMRRSAELQEGFEDPGRFREFMTWTHQANVFHEMGDDTASEAAARRAIETTRTEGPVQGRGEPHAALGHALLGLGRPAEARDALTEARQRLESMGNRVGVSEVLGALGRTHHALGDLARAQALTETAVQLAVESGAGTDAARHRCWLGRRALEAGDPAGALALARGALASLENLPGIEPTELDARSLIADALAAQGDAAGALAAHRDYHARFAAAHDARKTMQAQVLAAQYQLDLAQRDAARARLESAHLSEALAEIASRMASGHPAKATPATREVTPESLQGLGLRPRECEVLHWVVHGKSNEEIGIILGCSTETVKSHLKRIYTQLDVTNRTAAAASALSRLDPAKS